MVVLAMGFVSPVRTGLLKDLDVELDERPPFFIHSSSSLKN